MKIEIKTSLWESSKLAETMERISFANLLGFLSIVGISIIIENWLILSISLFYTLFSAIIYRSYFKWRKTQCNQKNTKD